MKNNSNQDSPWTAYWKKCYELTGKAEGLVKERIKGTRKGLPDEANYAHSFRVRDIVSKCHHWDDPDHDLFIAALLHDIVEDGGVTIKELKKMDFSDRTIELVKLCTHSMDIEDSTERWIRMIARLVEANDEDAWRIKLADLADNLSQSKGLSPENRRFMVEVKAPMLLRLARVYYSPRSMLEEEIEKQRKEIAKQWRYIVTQWTEEYDIDGLTNDFSVLGDFEDPCSAVVCAMTNNEAYIRNELETKEDWNEIERDDEVREVRQSPNKLNNIVFSKSASCRDKTGYESIYVFIDVIKVPYESIVSEGLFNRDCGWEVFRFFRETEKDTKVEDELSRLKRVDRDPVKCHLWSIEDLTDGDLDNAFDVVETFSKDSHFSRRLIKCKDCGQLYLREFYEEIDWIDGEDPQYMTYIPVKSKKEAKAINQAGLFEFQTFFPKINMNWPKDKPRTIRWLGR